MTPTLCEVMRCVALVVPVATPSKALLSPVPDVEPTTGEPGHAVSDCLATYRADPRRDGQVTFGMNAVIVEGLDRVLRPGMTASASHRFD